MKVLLYAFAPFGGNAVNISEQVLRAVTPKEGLYKQVFATKFARAQFINVAEKYQPQLIIGLGQYPKGKKLRIETIANNQYGTKSLSQISAIDENGKATLATNFPLVRTDFTVVSENAGRYVCNYSMYILLQWALSHNSQFCFLHIPKSFSIDIATAYLSQILENQL